MARVKIELPETFSFSCKIPVRIGDVNYGGHVGNDAILSIMQNARLMYFKSLGYSEMDLGGTSSIMADVAVSYKGEAFYEDVLEVLVQAREFHKYGFDLIYKIVNQDQKDIAHGKTGIICFDYNAKKIALLANATKEKLGGR